MENAAKALMMAGGILVGVLILALMVTLFVGSRSLSETYDVAKQQESIQQFNANFTKYLGQELTIHQVMTITNFAKIENNKIFNVAVSPSYTIDHIKTDVDNINDENEIEKYELVIMSYSSEGYIEAIKFTN